LLNSRPLRRMNKPMKKIYLSLFSLFLAAITIAQNSESEDSNHHWCGKNHHTQKHFEEYPNSIELAIQDSIELAEAARNFQRQKDGPYIIPVVFHIVHSGGDENISSEQVQSAIDALNEDFNAENSDIGGTAEAFQDIIADVGIEFRLARKDPDGNCTNGINRVFNTASNQGQESSIKGGDAATWGRESYLNVWVVRSIEGNSAAYAYLPTNAPWAISVDGVMIEHSFLGSIGTSQPYHRHTLSHEIGHWLNLEHTWGWTNTPGNSSNCNFDDGILDTPQTIGRQNYGDACDLEDETCGSLDNVQNMMDYGWCYTMFTNGQKNNMLTALESSTAGRNSLWTNQNLEDTGVLDTDVVCFADFTSEDNPIICPGGEVEFTDLSFNGITERQWTFEGGTPSTSTAASPVVTYNEPGTYEVSLVVSNENGSLSVTKSEFVKVFPSSGNNVPFEEGFESFTSLEPNDENWSIIRTDESGIEWEVTEDAAYSGDKSIYVNGRDNLSQTFQSIQTIASPTFDLSGVQADNAVLSFKYAHARRLSASNDRLRVFISRDCGDSWALRENITIDDLPTVSGTNNGNFVPTSVNEWTEVVIDNISSIFLTENFRFGFEFTSFRGNNIYIDDINLYDPATVGIDEMHSIQSLTIYPNPTNQLSVVELDLAEAESRMDVRLIDLSGRQLKNIYSGFMPAGNQRIELDLSALESGVYLIQFSSSSGSFTQKIVKQ